MKIHSISCLYIVLVLSACTTHTESILKNEKGDIRYCYLTNDHTLTSMGAVAEYTRCMNDAGSAGYRKVK